MSRRRSFGIAFPFLILALVVGGWTVWWFTLVSRLEAGLDQGAARLREAGWEISHAEPIVTGWPFRARLELADVEVVMPSGHGLRSEHMLAEALAYQPDRWVLMAPDGLSLGRGAKGWTSVTGQALRASVSGLSRTPPRVVVELNQPRFAAEAGAAPFPIASAERLIINLIPGDATGADEAGLLFELTGAAGRPGGPLEAMAEQRPFDLSAEAVIGQAGALDGATWTEALSAWAREGGALTEVRTEATAGEDYIRGASDQLMADANGRMTGDFRIDMRGGTAPLVGLASAPGVDPQAAAAVRLGVQITSGLRGDTGLTFRFTDGRTRVGPIDLGPAPKVF
ncbi:DUF2125 domain-containing protein [Brevundimonas sp.]|uniref:DUF2125 domain-containing protein n=1 Tax=Brevundimonas sp. TaxID=1871086 RepID=UPI002600277F|nr:DUF2125 domain-containing protein [Brevundimonas sp.]